jgi:hypothetical protein
VIRLPPPPRHYDAQHMTQLQAAIERALREAAIRNTQVSFGRVDTAQLYVDGVAYVAPPSLPLSVANGGTGVTSVPAIQSLVSISKFVNTTVPAGNTVANTVVETAFSSTYSIPAKSAKVGTRYRITARGTLRTALSAPTITLRLKFAGVTVCATPAMTCGSTSSNDFGFQFVVDVVQNSIGGLAAVEAQGQAAVPRTSTVQDSHGAANTGPVAGDTTVARAISLTAQWSAAAINNSITLRQFLVEEMPP